MSSGSESRVGVDIGGTFTDIVTIRDGRVRVSKTPSTPDTPERGVVDGLRQAAENGLSLADVSFFGHGTTVATNAVLEGEWADTALVTTRGFRDVLEIGRQARPDIYDFQTEKPAPVVERHRRYEVTERVDERGNVVTSLDESEVRALADELSHVDSVAVSLLFPFENPRHERRVRELLREEGVDAAISLSSTVLPEIREYERTLTTALNAALKPVMDSYIGALERDVAAEGVDAPLNIMQSNGGLITARVARERPVKTLLSGPAAGVQGATFVADRCGLSNVITMDMGGTSCDVSLVEGGSPVVSTDVAVGDYLVSVPTIDIHTVGAGGGSLAWIDAGGALRVGPKSAGAQPGPVCYGRGGTRPTITDAQAVLGRIDPSSFLETGLDGAAEEVRDAIERDVADELGVDVETAAQGILDVANANMERALRLVSVERGYDPREFGLVAFGGAGPLHAPKLAAELDIPRVVVPRTAGVLSALGLLISDTLYDYSTSRVRPLGDVDPSEVESTFAAFVAEGREQLEGEGLSGEKMRFEPAMDLRYAGQSFELSVPVSRGIDEAVLDTVAERFHERHRQRYGHAYPDEPVELVTLRLRARGVVETPDLRPTPRDTSLADARTETRPVVYGGETHETPVYDRSALPTESAFDGPAVVEGVESTTVVHPGQRVRVDGDATLVVEVRPS